MLILIYFLTWVHPIRKFDTSDTCSRSIKQTVSVKFHSKWNLFAWNFNNTGINQSASWYVLVLTILTAQSLWSSACCNHKTSFSACLTISWKKKVYHVYELIFVTSSNIPGPVVDAVAKRAPGRIKQSLPAAVILVAFVDRLQHNSC